MRTSTQSRKTLETEVSVAINLDGTGKRQIATGIRFFDHMLEQFAAHSGFDLELKVVSHDKDNHHVVEDVALTLGTAIKEALGDKKGISRYGEMNLPMDEALVLSVVDLSGRAFSKTDIQMNDERTSDFETVLLPHFFSSLAQAAAICIHIKMLDGEDTHHIIEATFKSFARALSKAVSLTGSDKVPSTKGVL